MANPVLDTLLAQIAASDCVSESATLLIHGLVAIEQDAVTAALAKGATAEELAPITEATTQIKDKTDALAAAVAANTPAPPPSPAQMAKAKPQGFKP